jgi:hypothetical protein
MGLSLKERSQASVCGQQRRDLPAGRQALGFICALVCQTPLGPGLLACDELPCAMKRDAEMIIQGYACRGTASRTIHQPLG